MNNNTPSPNQKSIDDAIRILKAKSSPIITPVDETDLDRLFKRLSASTRKIDALVAPIQAAERDSGRPIAKQREMLLATLHKFWLDEQMQYSQDEVRFLYAFANAMTMVENYI